MQEVCYNLSEVGARMEQFKVGDIIKVKVTGIEKYGIFVKVNHMYNGLIHISEISHSFVKDANDYVSINEEIYAQILEIDNINYKMKLSIKNINYKTVISRGIMDESRSGFLPLKVNLPIWIDKKLNEYKNKSDQE